MKSESVYNFFRSVKLAIVLILFITFTSLISTFIPQGKGPEFYSDVYPLFASRLIILSGFDNFFNSIIFLVSAGLFFINLSVCTFHRIKTRFKNKSKKRFGPDILHMGLLIMIIGGVITFSGRDEGFTLMKVGDHVTIPGGFTITLTDFVFLKYEDGSPKDWISTVNVKKGDKVIHEAYPIEVNRPLKAGNVKLYQSTYEINSFILVTDPEGTVYKLSTGQMIPVKDEGYILKNVYSDRADPSKSIAHFDHWKDHEIVNHLDYSISQSIDVYTITSMENSMSTGLQIVRDPGYYPILAGLLLLMSGLFITYFQKIYEG